MNLYTKYIAALLLILSLISTASWCQEIDPDFKKMIERKYEFPTISPDSLENNLDNPDFVLLDTREVDEYSVSHIPGALMFGYDNPNYDLLNDQDTSKTVIVYCSIGVRSQNIANSLKERGFEHVYNLYGGIFLWGDQFRPLENEIDKDTDRVHGYNRFWGRWVKKAPVVYE